MAIVSITQAIETFKTNPRFCKNITYWQHIPAKPAKMVPFPSSLSPEVQAYLIKKGINELYIHQAQAIEAASAGKDIVVVTPTASGKSLCYNLPVIESLLKNPEARALYLFPTKALSQDQVAELLACSEQLSGKIKTYTYDGDTPGDARKAIRSAGSIVVTNPDMLHTGILPHHTKWMRLFENLQFVVIDELHTYRGVYGSHVANVLRRLHRICRFYGSNPQFICTSATIANPKSHGEKLVGRAITVIDQNGAPQGPKEFIFYNPPVVNEPLGIRRSSLLEAENIAHHFISQNAQTIVFTRSRIDTEILVTYLKRSFERLGDVNERIRSYRGGYLPNQRRRIEKDLREGNVLGVVSTNALELGIDIGSLDAAVLTGYPGTIASTWQQIGRAGRSRDLSAAILVANSSPINQFIVSNPDYFLEKGAEQALINPDNLLILMSHIKCAAFELPFTQGELFGDVFPEELLDYLTEEQVLRKVKDKWYWMSENYPAVNISLRSASTENVTIIDTTDGQIKVIGEVDLFSAPMLVHEGAIYIHQSEQYHIDTLDWEGQKAYARRVNVDYFTDANLAVELKVLDVTDQKERSSSVIYWGEVMVAAKTHMYKKIKFYTHENVGWGEISLPEQQIHTTSYWLSMVCPAEWETNKDAMQSALLGASHLIGNIAPLELMCEPKDLGVTAQIRSPFTNSPTIYVYERYPGGVGFAQNLYDTHDALINRAYELLKACRCPSGCPSCVGPMDQLGPRGKEYTLKLFEEVLIHGHKE
jgi:DEAD/DEAH box helicase domain-containing protein